jgi:hypothetical protein
MQERNLSPNDLSDREQLARRMAALEAKVALLNERQLIVDLYRRYTRGLNRHDMELLNGTFWQDAEINYGFSSSPRDQWVKMWERERYLKGLSCQAHHITNETIDIAQDVAHVESYLIALWRPPTDDKPSLILAGRYIDRLDRRDGEWRIAVREFIPHFWSEATSIFHTTFNEESWPHTDIGLGAGDKSDLCYLRPLKSRSK